MLIVAWSLRNHPDPADITDHWIATDDPKEAQEKYDALLRRPDLYMANICQVLKSTDYDPAPVVEAPLHIANQGKRPTIFFKTGRAYTENGQRIGAQLLDNGGIIFVDIDRNIQGYFSPEVCRQHWIRLSPDRLIWGYDRHERTQYWIGVYDHDADIKALQDAARANKQW